LWLDIQFVAVFAVSGLVCAVLKVLVFKLTGQADRTCIEAELTGQADRTCIEADRTCIEAVIF
jgi:hypothetical protein